LGGELADGEVVEAEYVGGDEFGQAAIPGGRRVRRRGGPWRPGGLSRK